MCVRARARVCIPNIFAKVCSLVGRTNFRKFIRIFESEADDELTIAMSQG